MMGKLLKHGSFNCARLYCDSIEPTEKLKPYHIYVFEQIVLFCEEQSKRNSFSQPVYVYKGHIPVNVYFISVHPKSVFIFYAILSPSAVKFLREKRRITIKININVFIGNMLHFFH